MGRGRVVIGMLALVVSVGCSDGGEDTAPDVAARPPQARGGEWGVFASYGNEVEGFATLAEMGPIADVVVIAQPTGVDGGGGFDLVRVRFEVIRAISDGDEGPIVVELDMPSEVGLAELEETVPGLPPALLALRDKGGEEAGRYRLVSSQALWTEEPDGGLFGPVAQDDNGFRIAATAPDVTSLEQLGDHLGEARRACEPRCGRSEAPGN